ncbi:MAG: hypothetical protein WKF73_17235 [Nocardioidaceae bacterium]
MTLSAVIPRSLNQPRLRAASESFFARISRSKSIGFGGEFALGIAAIRMHVVVVVVIVVPVPVPVIVLFAVSVTMGMRTRGALFGYWQRCDPRLTCQRYIRTCCT